MLVSDLPTPALLIDRARLLANLDAMQARADAAGVALRPHAKTHKSPDLARLQIARGARGLTVATIDEAEAFAAAGVADLRLATTVAGAGRLARIARLLDDGVALSFTVDTEAGARQASDALAGRAAPAEVLIEIDTGHGRCGVAPADAPALGAAVAALPGLRLAGVLTHGGHAYDGPRPGETAAEARARVMRDERDGALEAAHRLGEAGLLDAATAVVSVGSTPTAMAFAPATRGGFRVTEIRPGNYVFGDAQQVALGSMALRDCALVALGTVLARHRRADGTERVITDAGKKLLSTDTGAGVHGYGTLLYSPRTMVALPHAVVHALSEEHGWIDTPGGSIYDVGDPVYLVPNHACVAVATRSALHLVEGDEVVGTWATVAR
jgi:D-serine deaminase-like pyridoxal phosphate-dependent protein